MDILKKSTELLSRYRYAVLVLIVGIFLMLLPSSAGKKESAVQIPAVQEETLSVAQQLEQILSAIDGVGKVQVLLTEAEGVQTLYQYDEGSGTDTVIITDENKAQHGLIRQVIPPTYQGAIIVCQGADSAVVRLSVVEAVANATGLSSDRISVLKMK